MCEDVVVSHFHGKHRLDGVIGSIAVPSNNPVAPGYVVYGRVSNVHLHQRLEVAFMVANTERELWKFEADFVNRNDPLAVHTIIVKTPPFRVGESGRHLLRAIHNGVPLAEVPVEVVLISVLGQEAR